eukprot:gnl/Hemi2/14099_TR4780_c0_g1_i1.p1 gnl/Hemi2/14099_TR4780_c0_g1~~gnl/Hemi2/14099_TR4780_c0_g1_i1.p1  ORF type:complete len:260 (-),score=45.21 gnl/Hemi2/14099_TR4780_c0_g1_i1:81-812(-)
MLVRAGGSVLRRALLPFLAPCRGMAAFGPAVTSAPPPPPLPSLLAKNPHLLTAEDIMPTQEYLKLRKDYRKQRVEMRKARRIQVGPHASVLFENYDMVWMQVQEMLYVERGTTQVEEELDAYNPLIPKGSSLVVTLMFEVVNATQRRNLLIQLSGVENTVSLKFPDGSSCSGVCLQPIDEVSQRQDRRTSAVHFLRFDLSPSQIQAIKAAEDGSVTLGVSHPSYRHATQLSGDLLATIAKDLS